MSNERPRAQGVSSGRVLALLGLLFVLAVGGFLVLYSRLVDYERVARLHVPQSASFAARVDLTQALVFGPVRKHIVPVLLGRPQGERAEAIALERLENATGVNLGMDLREVVLVRRAQATGLALGGRLPREGVVQGLGDLLRRDGTRGCVVRSSRLRCVVPSFSMQQADSGVVVVATDEALLDDMLRISDGYQRLGIENESAGSFGIAFSEPSAGVAGLASWPMFGQLGRLLLLHGRMLLGDELQLVVEAVPRPGESLAHWRPELERLRSLLQGLLALRPGADYAGERAVLDRMRFDVAGERLIAQATWSEAEVQRGAASLAALLREWLRPAP